MKLSKLQKHYQKTFNKIRRYTPPGAPVRYYKPEQLYPTTYQANKHARLYAKYMNSNIVYAQSQSNINANNSTKLSSVLDILVQINDILCLVVLSEKHLNSIHMICNKNDNARNGHKNNPFPHEYPLTSVVHNNTVLNSSIRSYNKQTGIEVIFRNTLITTAGKDTKELRNIEQNLNDIVQTYSITDEEIQEELMFQIDTIVPNAQYYIPLYQRAIHINKQLQYYKDKGITPTIVQCIRLCNGL